MDDLVAFLKARLGEDEAAVKAVTFRSQFLAEGHSVVSRSWPGNPPMPIADVIDAETAAHIAWYDPARTLREVEAKRAILARHHPQDHALHGRLCAWCSSTSVSLYQKWPCPDARDLAAVYASHPDYRPEWKPQP